MKYLAPFSLLIFVFVIITGFAIAPQTTHAATNTQMCYDLYQPVCAAQQVECFAAPCYPVYKTYSNSCFMQNDNATIVHEGVCSSTETGPVGKPGTTTPPVTTSPYTPPAATSSTPVVTPPHHTPTSTPVITSSTSVSTGTTTATSSEAVHVSFFSRLWHMILGWFGFH